MFHYAVLLAMVLSAASAAPTCENGVTAVAQGLKNTLVNQTEILTGLGQFVDGAFKAGKEYEVSSFYQNIYKSIDQFEKTIKMGLETGAFKDELKSLDIENLVKLYQNLDSKQKMQNGIFKDVVRKLKESEQLIQNGTSSSAAGQKCEEKMSKLLDISAYALYQGANDLNSALSDIYIKYGSSQNPAKELDSQLLIAKKVATTLETGSSHVGEVKYSETQLQRLRDAEYFFEGALKYIEEMQKKQTSSTLEALDSAVKHNIENIKKVIN